MKVAAELVCFLPHKFHDQFSVYPLLRIIYRITNVCLSSFCEYKEQCQCKHIIISKNLQVEGASIIP